MYWLNSVKNTSVNSHPWCKIILKRIRVYRSWKLKKKSEESFWTSENDLSPATKSSRTGNPSENRKRMQLCLASHLSTFIHFIWTGVLSQMGACCIKLKPLKYWTSVRFGGEVRLRWQGKGTASLNHEVQSSWTMMSCFWEEIINGQPKGRKCIGWVQNREGGTSQNTWLSRLGSNLMDGVQRECKWAHKASLSFSFWLGQVLSLALCYQKKIGLVSHL